MSTGRGAQPTGGVDRDLCKCAGGNFAVLGARVSPAGWSRQLSTSVKELEVKNLFNRFVSEEAGQDLIEYALLAGLISLVCVLAIQAAGTKVSKLFDNVKTSIP